MKKIKFLFDENKNAWNIWDSANSENPFSTQGNKLDKKLRDMIEGKTKQESIKILKKNYKNIRKSLGIRGIVKGLQESWSLIEEEFFNRLFKIMKRNKEIQNISAYINFSPRCPYNYGKDPWFMIYIFSPISRILATCGHEIMHIYFHKFYWKKIAKQIGEKKTGDLKEALTVLLNLEFRDLWFVEDLGYEMHDKLRKFIEEKWKEEKDFEKLLEKCVEYFKNS